MNFLEKQRLAVCVNRLSDSDEICKKVVSIDVDTVEVSASDKQKLVALENERQMIDADTTLTTVQREHKKYKVRLKAKKYKVKLKHKKIPVRLGTE